MAKTKIEDVDLYAILDLTISATEPEIKKAYRKKALQCHPDKNPDDPKAAEAFHELSRALEILTDAAARSAYDKVLRAKEAAKLRHKELDSKRQKLKEDLERREREAMSGSGMSNLTDEQKLAAEIQRLQKEGSRLLQEEQKRVKEEIQRSLGRLTDPVWDSSLNRIKIKWKADKTDESNGGYDEATLRKFLKKYGDIVALIISPKKKGSALVEFTSKEASDMAIEFEKGIPENPLTLKWLNDKPVLTTKRDAPGPSLVSDRDYESLVMTKMRQAAERQRLIEQMMKEEGAK
ncbi:dnaJ homolog subfamily C member 17 [Leguminivora glycinivorella]|uniref:dnaJ homolog subfamily C member 17 n=1 Tax=Leguminivora glycinivorella TaxID=1035111 RepID=UPI00200BB6FA|nr:dnaJ homolog subfamily C member 17 [Leguminivora glycinivorella]